MKIKEVTFEELRNLGNYENIKVSLTATISADDDIDFVLDKLRKKTRNKLNEYENKRS